MNGSMPESVFTPSGRYFSFFIWGNRMTSRIDGCSGEQHDQPVDAEPQPAGGRHAVLQGADVVLVHPVGLVVAGLALSSLLLEALPLSTGSFSSEKALASSAPGDVELEPVGHLRRASSLRLASGDMSTG